MNIPDSIAAYWDGAILLVDKPLHWTSFDVVNKIRYTLQHQRHQKIKVGHAGTLDPLATGLVVIATGKATKQLSSLTGLDKSYDAIIHLGATTPSYDLETPPQPQGDASQLTTTQIEAALTKFRGTIMQQPPDFSAIKKGGRPAYKAARQGQQVNLPSRQVTIHQMELQQWNAPQLHLTIHCSKGTYIRSIAHDLGRALNVGGYLAALRRTAIGNFSIDDAKRVEEWVHLIKETKP